MADIIRKVDYTSKDYEAYRQDMIDQIPKKLPEWTDTSEADPGIVILELIANELEKLSYYNDRVANEAFLPTATKRKSVMKHLKLIDYEMSWATPARHWQMFQIVPQPVDTIIPRGFQVGTKGDGIEDTVIFETVDDLVIPAGQTGTELDVTGFPAYLVEVEQGQTIPEEFLGEVTEERPDLTFKLAYAPVHRPSIEIFVEDHNGKYAWNPVEDFINSGLGDEHYVSEMNEFGEVLIRFGTGASGKIPAVGSNIYATYKVGGGKIGNVGKNTITEFFTALPGLEATTNPQDIRIYGTDSESNEDAKRNGPVSLRVLNRYVTKRDFEDGLRLDYPSIAKIKAVYDSEEDKLHLYMAPFGGGEFSFADWNQISYIINQKKILFTGVVLHDPNYVTVDVSLDVYIDGNFYDSNILEYAVINTLQEKFSVENMDFGKEVSHSDITLAVMLLEGVKKVIINDPSSDIELDQTEIAKLGNVEVNIINVY